MLKQIKLVYKHNFLTKELKHEMIEYLILNSTLFLVPFLFGHPQLIVGTIVNAGIIYIALNYKEHKLFPAIFLPAIGAIMRGVLFGPFTPYLIWLLPFIWISNAILLFSIRFTLYKKIQKNISFVIGALLKAGFLYSITLIMVNSFELPRMFLNVMGITQIGTALAGGVLYLMIEKIRFNGNS